MTAPPRPDAEAEGEAGRPGIGRARLVHIATWSLELSEDEHCSTTIPIIIKRLVSFFA